MDDATKNYPLHWPQGWPRASLRKRAKFSTKRNNVGGMGYGKALSISDGVERVLAELKAFGVGDWDCVISTNVLPRLNGYPRSGEREPEDPGVAVYWNEGGGARKVMAIDIYDRVADNLGAIAATLDAMRAIERHGGAQVLERAFTGFTALSDRPHWATTLGVSPQASASEVDAAFRRLAAQHHPDKPGGSHERMAEITAARQQALKERAA